MSDKKTRYTLTAAVGNGKAGSFIELTDAQAKSPLYASRIAALPSGGAADAVDVEALREEIRDKLMADMEKSVPSFLVDAQAKADKLVADAKTESLKLVEAAKAEATAISDKAAADAKAAAKK